MALSDYNSDRRLSRRPSSVVIPDTEIEIVVVILSFPQKTGEMRDVGIRLRNERIVPGVRALEAPRGDRVGRINREEFEGLAAVVASLPAPRRRRSSSQR